MSIQPRTAEYRAAHARVRHIRGDASSYSCARCNGRAHDWARVHTESGQDALTNYVALCVSCHISYDHKGFVGEHNNFAKLTAADVLEIRRRYADGEVTTRVALASEFGVTPENIGAIKSRRSWRHI